VARVSVLYIRDDVVAPHLELLRNICEPGSKARPHVTVRFFKKLAIPADHLDTVVSHVDLLAAGAFLDIDPSRPNRTVFIRCQSDDLLTLEHKPQFPTSEFHITIYDGSSELFAKKLIGVLKKFPWAFRVALPKKSSLATIEIKKKRVSKNPAIKVREYDPKVKELFEKIFEQPLSEDLVLSFSDKKKLEAVKRICASLHEKTENFEKVKIPRHRSVVGLDRFPEKDYDIHLTPPELAQEIAAIALEYLTPGEIKFGDPAVGTGAFYAALLKVAGKGKIKSAIGIDISPKQVEAAKWRWKNEDMEVREGDYLHMSELPLRNLILANPPYLRHQKIPTQYKHELRERASTDMGMKISGRSGQYVYFILLSHKWMERGAIASWLIPSEFMQTDYGKALRQYLTRKVQLLRIHQFAADTPQFENAEVLPCVIIFKNIEPSIKQEITFSVGGTLSRPTNVEYVNIAHLNSEEKWTLQRRDVIERDHTFVKLGDLFSVKRGIATGANNFFVLDRDRAKELGIPDFALKPLLPKAMNLGTDVIERKHDGTPDLEKQLCVIDCALPELEIERNYPSFAKYLNTGKTSGIVNGYLVARRSPWYKQEQRPPPIFLCTYMGKAHGDKPAIRFIWNKSDAIATNTYLMLYPNSSVCELLKKEPRLSLTLFNLLKDSSWHSLHEFSRSHAGGLSKIEPRELEEVWLGPLPNSILQVANKRLL
jgi:adenine-specific DNA-methyltransferase